MKTIQYRSTLFYYDGPQVFEARDDIGGHYVGVMVEPTSSHDRFLVTGTVPGRLREFLAGTLDLRSLLLEQSEREWFLTEAEGGLEQPLKLIEQSGSLIESGLLPESGFLLHGVAEASSVLSEARTRNSLILEIAVTPPEAAEEHRIRVGTLSGLLGHIQMLIKHAYGAARRELSLSVRRRIDASDAHLLDVIIPAAAGSFRVVLEGVKRGNLFGESELSRAMQRIDRLFEFAAEPEKAMAAMKENRGHLAGAYLRLLRFLMEHKTGLRYSWADPTSAKSQSHSVSEAETGVLVDAFSGIANLGAEPAILVGTLEKADDTNGTWRILTAEGKFSGGVQAGGPSLKGLKIGSQYKFTCIEEIEELEATGRERRALYLIERAPI